MDSSHLRALLDESLSKSEHVYAAHVEDPTQYIASGKEHLIASLVAPLSVASELIFHGQDTGKPPQYFSGWAIAQSDSRWLFYCPADRLFHIAWGSDANSLEDANWASDDALAIWLL